jgi:hypothetical protein
MTRSYRARLELVRGSLGERDLGILCDLATVRLLSVSQVERLRFAEGSALTRARRCRSSLQRLHDLGVVARLERRVGGIYGGSHGHIYGLSALGQRLIGEHGPAGGDRARRHWEPSLPFVAHLLGVSELYVRLHAAERDGRIAELRFAAEPACWRHWTSVSGEDLIVKPDAFASFAHAEFDYAYFIEVDRGTQSTTVIRRKGEVYVDYFTSGVEQQRLGFFPKVLFLTEHHQRSERLVQALGRLDPEHWQLFQVTTEGDDLIELLRAPPEAA